MKKEFLEKTIKNRIFTIRGVQVMIDSDLAELYKVDTKVLNQAVRRNIDRFPAEFMFQLTDSEYGSLRSQFVTLKTKRGQHRKYLPFAFTEQGVAMLSAVLKSNIAIKVSIQIINAFVSMRRFIASNALIFERLDRKLLDHDKKFEEIFNLIEAKAIKPEKGIFYNGQIFDAHNFVSNIIRSAKESIILIDNYVDDSVLTLFRKTKAKVTIYTNNVSKQLRLDSIKYNKQYNQIKLSKFKKSHDRFLIMDNKEVYHFGASLKDLGKKWFAFSKFNKDAVKMLEKLK